jgi:LPXTG-motif cell wall-anchored protein
MEWKLTVVSIVDENNATINRADTDYRLTRCIADGSFCCGTPGSKEAGDCCNAGKGVFLDNLKIVSTKPASQSTSASSSTTPSASASSSTAPSQGPTSNKSNTGAIAGGVVAGVAGITIIALAVWLLMRRRKRHGLVDNPYQHQPEAVYVQDKYRYDDEPLGELPAEHTRELPAENTKPVEMEALVRRE